MIVIPFGPTYHTQWLLAENQTETEPYALRRQQETLTTISRIDSYLSCQQSNQSRRSGDEYKTIAAAAD
jgi:hypothetical protein